MGRKTPGVQNRNPIAKPLARGTLSQTPAHTPGVTGLAQAIPSAATESLGQQVLHFARKNIGLKVGDGECFALADKALRNAKAATAEDFCKVGGDTDYVWSSQEENISDALPGDILQFRDFAFERRVDKPDGSWKTQTESRPHHTAVIESVRTESGIVFFTILEQNVTIGNVGNQGKKTVRRNEIPTSSGETKNGRDTITYQVSGTLWVYRPVASLPSP